MGILDEQKRFIRFGVEIVCNIFESRVHAAVEIDVRNIIRPVPRHIICALIVRQSGRVGSLRPAERLLKGATVSAFIPHGPDKDGRPVAVSQHHGGHPVQSRFDESGIVCDPFMRELHPLGIIIFCVIQGRRPVAFIVRFVDNIQPQFVTELVKIRSVRIVAGTDSVEIIFLDHEQILQHLFRGINGTSHGIGFVTVNAAELDRRSVQQQNSVPDADTAEAHALPDDFMLRVNNQGIKIRGLCVPEERFSDCDMSLSISFRSGCYFPGCIQELQAHRYGFMIERKPDGQFSLVQVLRQRSRDEIVRNVRLRTAKQINITKDSGHSEFILVFQIGPVTPLKYQHGQKVFSLSKQAGNIKLRGVVRHLAISDISAVQPDIKA